MEQPARATVTSHVAPLMSQERRRSGRRSTDRFEQVFDAGPSGGEAVGGWPGTFGTTLEPSDQLAPRVLRGTVLLVDGDPASLSELSRELLGSDYRVIRAVDAANALGVLGRWPVDVILTALELDGMGGLELLGLARTRRPEAIRIILSSCPDVASAVSAINREEVFRYLTKPVCCDQLLATVQLALERRWAASEVQFDAAAPAQRLTRGRPVALGRLARPSPPITFLP